MLERWGGAVPAGGGGAAAHRLCGSAAGGGGGTAIGNRRRTPTARCRRGLAALQQLQNQSPISQQDPAQVKLASRAGGRRGPEPGAGATTKAHMA